jgi:hypothetical protein
MSATDEELRWADGNGMCLQSSRSSHALHLLMLLTLYVFRSRPCHLGLDRLLARFSSLPVGKVSSCMRLGPVDLVIVR